MSFISIEFDKNSLKEIEKKINESPKELKKAGVLAINRTLDMAKTRLVKNATERYTIKRSDLVSSLSMKKANYSNMSAKIQSRGKVIGLDHFKLYPKVRPKKRKLVSVSVKKGSKKTLGNNSFIAYRSGFLGAFSRVSSKRLPIKRLMGPSAPQMLGNEETMPEIENFMEEKLNERFIHEINRLL